MVVARSNRNKLSSAFHTSLFADCFPGRTHSCTILLYTTAVALHSHSNNCWSRCKFQFRVFTFRSYRFIRHYCTDWWWMNLIASLLLVPNTKCDVQVLTEKCAMIIVHLWTYSTTYALIFLQSQSLDKRFGDFKCVYCILHFWCQVLCSWGVKTSSFT